VGAPSSERASQAGLIALAAAGFCSKCGNPVKGDTVYCPKCGSQIGAAAAPPSASTPILPRKSRKRLWVAIGVVIVVAVVALSGYAYEVEPGNALNPYKVRVSQVIWTQNGYSLGSTAGFSVKAGSSPSVSFTLNCPSGFFGPQTCSSGSVYVLTAGFGVASTNAPFTWSSGDSGATAAVTVKLTTPTSAYSGDLEIDLH
jgi:zinc-ribbon domain